MLGFLSPNSVFGNPALLTLIVASVPTSKANLIRPSRPCSLAFVPPPLRPSASPPLQRKKRVEDLQKKLIKEFGCRLCKAVLTQPLTMPCGHTFCKACLDGKFGATADTRERAASSGRTMRVQKVVKPCPEPGCKRDICEYLRTAQARADKTHPLKSQSLPAIAIRSNCNQRTLHSHISQYRICE